VGKAQLGSISLTALIAAGLAGCGGGIGATSSSTPSSPAARTPSSPAPASTSTPSAAPPAATAGLTAAGAKLAVGQTATVPYKPPSDVSNGPAKLRLRVTVLSIVKGSLADFKGIQLDATQKAGTPYYVKFRITNAGTGDANAKDDPGIQIEGVDSTGQTQQSVTFIGDFPACTDTSAPKPMPEGRSVASCATFLVPGGITAAAYTGAPDYISSPVTWK
jgi:hypothetical protein